MATERDDDVLTLLRKIRATQEDQGAELSLLGPVAASVANLNYDVREISTKLIGLDQKVTGLDEKVTGLDERVTGLDEKVTGLREKVDGLGGEIKRLHVEIEIMKLDAHDTRVEIHEMRGDIQEIRSDIHTSQTDVHELKLTVTSHGLRFDFLDERVEMFRDGTLRAIEAAVNASGTNVKVREDLAALTKRVEKLEASR